jgi:hypothetical protein
MPVDVVGGDGDLEAALGSFVEGGAVEGVIVVGAVGVEELHGAGAENLEAVVEVCAGGEVLGAEAGAGIVDLEELEGLRGVVAYSGFDVGGVAAGGDQEKAGERECEDGTHKAQEYQEYQKYQG